MKQYMHEGIAYPDAITPIKNAINAHYDAPTGLEQLTKMCEDIRVIFVGDCMDVDALISLMSESGHDVPAWADDDQIATAWRHVIESMPNRIKQDALDAARAQSNVESIDLHRPFVGDDDIPDHDNESSHTTCADCGCMYRREAFCLNSTCCEHVAVRQLRRGDIILHERDRWIVEGVEQHGIHESLDRVIVHLVDENDRGRAFGMKESKRIWRKGGK